MQQSYYPEQIMNYLISLPNSGKLVVNNNDTFSVSAGDITKGVVITLYCQINDGIITKLTYQVYGNGYMIAALGRMTEELVGQKVKQMLNYSLSNLVRDLEIPHTLNNKLKFIKQCLDEIHEKYKHSLK